MGSYQGLMRQRPQAEAQQGRVDAAFGKMLAAAPLRLEDIKPLPGLVLGSRSGVGRSVVTSSPKP